MLLQGARESSILVVDEIAVVVGSISRQQSVTAGRCQARLLLDRLEGLMGDGGPAAINILNFVLAVR